MKAKIEVLSKNVNGVEKDLFPLTVTEGVIDPATKKNTKELFVEKADHGYPSEPKTLKEVDDDKASHGYESNPKTLKEVDNEKAAHGYGAEPQKTLKQVDDEVIQLAGDVNDDINGIWFLDDCLLTKEDGVDMIIVQPLLRTVTEDTEVNFSVASSDATGSRFNLIYCFNSENQNIATLPFVYFNKSNTVTLPSGTMKLYFYLLNTINQGAANVTVSIFAQVGIKSDIDRIHEEVSGISLDQKKINVDRLYSRVDPFFTEPGINLNDKVGTATPSLWIQSEASNYLKAEAVDDTESPFAGILEKMVKVSNETTSGGNLLRTYANSAIGTPQKIEFGYWIKDSQITQFGQTEILFTFNMNFSGSAHAFTYDIVSIINGMVVSGSKEYADLTFNYSARKRYSENGWSQIIISITDIEWLTPWVGTMYFFFSLPSSVAGLMLSEGYYMYFQNVQFVLNAEIPAGKRLINDTSGTVTSDYVTLSEVADVGSKLISITGLSNKLYYNSLSKSGYILTDFDVANLMKLNFMTSSFPQNPGLRISELELVNKSTGVETRVHFTLDDNAPANYNGTYIGGNHGCASVRECTAVAHGKTYADIGSEWVDGVGNKYYIVKIISNDKIWILGENTATYPHWVFRIPSTGAITHSSGATNTSDIVITSVVTSQLTPATKLTSSKILIDGTEINSSGFYDFKEMIVYDISEIMNPASILQKLIDGVGTFSENPDYSTLGADNQAATYVNYKFVNSYTYFITSSFIQYQDIVNPSRYGFTQQTGLDGAILQYIPKMLPVGEYDFRTLVDVSSGLHGLGILDAATYSENPLLPPDRWIQISDKVAVSSGYLFDHGVGGDKRINNIFNFWYFPDTGKNYPIGIDSKVMGTANESFSAVVFRKYLPLSEISKNGERAVTMFEYNNAFYVYADYYIAGEYLIEIDASYAGKSIAILEKSSNINVYGDVATGVIKVNVTSALPMYAYIVMKLK